MVKTTTVVPSVSSASSEPEAQLAAPTKWTVMVFMGAETEEGNAPMIQPAVDDLLEMADVGSGGQLQIFVQVHTSQEVRRSRIERRMFKAIASKGLRALELLPDKEARALKTDAPSGQALTDFIIWSLNTADHKPDDENHCCMLVLWGHAYNFAMGHAPGREGVVDAFDFVQLSETLKNLQQRVQIAMTTKKPPKLDVIGFDACDVATGEVAYELAPYADYLLSSQVGVPIPGWPYGNVLKLLRWPRHRTMTPVELGNWTVSRFCEAYSPLRTVSLSMLDLTRAGRLSDRISVLAAHLIRFSKENDSCRALVSESFWSANTEVDKPYIDVADLCLSLVRECGDPEVNTAARALGDFIVAPQVSVVDDAAAGALGPADAPRYPFVTAYGRNASETARLNGVSLYAPHVAPDYDYRAVQELYGKFKLAERTAWHALVHALLD